MYLLLALMRTRGHHRHSGMHMSCVPLQVHERHLNTDLLLALCRALALQRPELRVVVMSATINVRAYSDYFGAAPVITVGRLA